MAPAIKSGRGLWVVRCAHRSRAGTPDWRRLSWNLGEFKQERGVDQQKLLELLCKHLAEDFRCHTAILHGSLAHGDWDDASDIDVSQNLIPLQAALEKNPTSVDFFGPRKC